MIRNKGPVAGAEHASGRRKYRAWHWGNPATHVLDVEIPGVPDDHELTECGLLVGFHIDPRDDLPLPRQRAETMDEAANFEGNEPDVFSVVRVLARDYNHNHLIFDTDHPRQRLYAVLSPSTRADAAKLWRRGAKTTTLDQLARKAGGHQDDGTYPPVPVQELGRAYFVTYFTHKKGDDPASKYIHRFGEDGGVEPILAVDKTGRLWLAGGSYTCPTGGITR